jgi:hypothetical protein
MIKGTADSLRWLNFKINVLEKLIYDKKLDFTKSEIENAVDVVLGHDKEYKGTIKMLRRFVVANKKSGQGGTFHHISEHRIDSTQHDRMMVIAKFMDSSDLYFATDIFKDVDLEAALERFEDKFKTLKK